MEVVSSVHSIQVVYLLINFSREKKTIKKKKFNICQHIDEAVASGGCRCCVLTHHSGGMVVVVVIVGCQVAVIRILSVSNH